MAEINSRIIVSNCTEYPFLNNKTGVVKWTNGAVAAVEFDEPFELGHCCNMVADIDNARGYFVPSDSLSHIENDDSDKSSKIVIDDDTAKVITFLQSHNWNANTHAVIQLVQEWRSKKSKLKELFSKHPNWDEKTMSIRWSRDEVREINADITEGAFAVLINFIYCQAKKNNSQYQNEIAIINDIFYGYYKQFIDEQISQRIQDVFDIKIAPGSKTSKALNKLMKAFGFDKYNDQMVDGAVDKTRHSYDKLFAVYADSVNPIVIKRHTLASINIMDFLTMSYGTGWQSCHKLGSPGCTGGWSSGTLSYALDDVSFILYTVDGDYNETSFWEQPKITRQIFCFDTDTLLQSRLYPCSANESRVDDYRNLIQGAIAQCLDTPNRWTFRTVHCCDDKNNGNIIHKCGATNYPDYYHNSGSSGLYYTYLSYLRDKKITPILVGSEPMCVNCGKRHNHIDSLYCSDCSGWVYLLSRQYPSIIGCTPRHSP